MDTTAPRGRNNAGCDLLHKSTVSSGDKAAAAVFHLISAVKPAGVVVTAPSRGSTAISRLQPGLRDGGGKRPEGHRIHTQPARTVHPPFQQFS